MRFVGLRRRGGMHWVKEIQRKTRWHWKMGTWRMGRWGWAGERCSCWVLLKNEEWMCRSPELFIKTVQLFHRAQHACMCLCKSFCCVCRNIMKSTARCEWTDKHGSYCPTEDTCHIYLTVTILSSPDVHSGFKDLLCHSSCTSTLMWKPFPEKLHWGIIINKLEMAKSSRMK